MKAIYISQQPQPDRPAPTQPPTPAPPPDPGLAQRPITEAMSSPVLCVRIDTLLSEALQVMVRAGRRHLVVVDDTGRCAGVLADRALAATWAHNPGSLARDPVAVALDSEPAAIGVGARVLDAARLMRAAGDDAVAVVDAHGRPVGIVTGTDLINLLSG